LRHDKKCVAIIADIKTKAIMDTMCTKSQHHQRFFILLILSIFLNFSSSYSQDGAALFKQNCASCHSLGKNKLTGPGLEGVTKRVPSEEWLHKWIKNNKAVIASGDAYAKKIYEEFNKAEMTTFEHLSDAEIASIIELIKNPPAPKGQTTTPTPGGAPVEEDEDGNQLFLLLALVLVLGILYYVLKGVKKSLKNFVNEKQGIPAAPEYGVVEGTKIWMRSNKKMVAVLSLVLVAWLSKVGWDALAGIGIYEGYQPEQPINFSHKIHAGENGINCQYCHSGAERSKTAGVPSANVCMNCHKGIQSGTLTGDTEIKKIYAALDYDPNTQKYGNNPKPIKWIRVHNLPDHVYFNHSQHVVVGKQECQTCHGPIQEMDVVKQHSQLTMAWCIECHRKTEVAMEGNPYYNELHAKLAEKYKGEKITVAKMGGIECSKCHY